MRCLDKFGESEVRKVEMQRFFGAHVEAIVRGLQNRSEPWASSTDSVVYVGAIKAIYIHSFEVSMDVEGRIRGQYIYSEFISVLVIEGLVQVISRFS